MSTDIFVSIQYNAPSKRKQRPSELLPCDKCGGTNRKKNSNKCIDCFNDAQRQRWRDQKNGTIEVKARKSSNAIKSYLAVDEPLKITLDTPVQCYYSKAFRVCILAVRRKDAKEWLKTHKGVVKEDFMDMSTCRISEIDVNLTDIDLTQYGWKPKTRKVA
jgi:hypothetical protein